MNLLRIWYVTTPASVLLSWISLWRLVLCCTVHVAGMAHHTRGSCLHICNVMVTIYTLMCHKILPKVTRRSLPLTKRLALEIRMCDMV